MNIKLYLRTILGSVLPVGIFVSCKEKPREVEIVERREICQYDNPKVYRNGFTNWRSKQPASWRRVKATKFRELNYFTQSATEIALGVVGGGDVLANLNRWKREFDQNVLENLDGLETIEILDGMNAYIVQLRGTFQKKLAGMPVKAEGWAVTGLICDFGGGSLLTIKMMGPASEVDTEQKNLRSFIKELDFIPVQKPNERSNKEVGKDTTEKEGY